MIKWTILDKEKEGNICIYCGSGAILANDVEFALKELGISFKEIDEDDIKEGKLNDCSVLIIPGGYTEEYVNTLSEKGFEAIREFVFNNGGGYIGICAGAYLAAEQIEVPGKPQGLGIIDIQNIREGGTKMRKIYLKDHPITNGLGNELEIYYQNGPEIIANGKVKEVASYENGKSAIVVSSFGKGTIVIFSPHPEGCMTHGIKPTSETLELLKNSIEFCTPDLKI